MTHNSLSMSEEDIYKNDQLLTVEIDNSNEKANHNHKPHLDEEVLKQPGFDTDQSLETHLSLTEENHECSVNLTAEMTEKEKLDEKEKVHTEQSQQEDSYEMAIQNSTQNTFNPETDYHFSRSRDHPPLCVTNEPKLSNPAIPVQQVIKSKPFTVASSYADEREASEVEKDMRQKREGIARSLRRVLTQSTLNSSFDLNRKINGKRKANVMEDLSRNPKRLASTRLLITSSGFSILGAAAAIVASSMNTDRPLPINCGGVNGDHQTGYNSVISDNNCTNIDDVGNITQESDKEKNTET